MLICLCITYTGAGQESAEDTVHVLKQEAWAELSAFGADISRTPFWLQTNQWGVVPVTGNAGGLTLGWKAGYRPGKSDWSYGIGIEGVGYAAKESKLWLPQAYAAVKYKELELSAGRRKELYGFAGEELGSGAYLFSGNALPIPRIQLGFTEYTPVPFTNRWLYVKGTYAEGWFEANRLFTSKLKLHHKSLYLRLGKPGRKLKLHAGFTHAVQWGGKTPFFAQDEQMPADLQAYWYVITGLKPNGRLRSGSQFDNSNRVGNHLASVDGALEWENDRINILAYRQNLVEDGSLFYLANIKDGLNGLRIRFKNTDASFFEVNTLLIELLHTKNQGESQVINASRGRDDYFNNAQVRDGWSYFWRTIGTPFITPSGTNLFPPTGAAFANNNRVTLGHLGASGKLGSTLWATRLSYSSNQGTFYASRPDTRQFSGILTFQRAFYILGGNTSIGLGVAVDRGGLYPATTGLRLSLRKDLL